MLFFSVSFKREIPRIMFVILTQRPCSPVLVLTWRSSYVDTVGEGVKTGKSSGQCTVEIPVQGTAREFHTSLPYRRTSPLVNNFLNPAIHSLKLHTQKKNMSSQGPCCSKKKKKTICALSVHAQASTQVSFMSSQATLHQGRVNLCTRLREHPQPTSRMPHCVACHPCR